MGPQIRPATRRKARLRLALDGPSKSGKTYTALRLAMMMGRNVGLIDAEDGTSELYAGIDMDGMSCEYDVLVLDRTGPDDYVHAINQFAEGEYDVIVIDGISQAWSGPGGVLELHDNVKGRSGWTDWLKVNPVQARFIKSIRSYPGHVIATMRTATDWVVETAEGGKAKPRKIGLKPQQRPGIEYEFDMLGSLDVDHVITITGSRCPGFDGATAAKPGKSFWLPLMGWLETGEAVEPETRLKMITDEQMATAVASVAQLGLSPQVMSARLMRQYQATQLNVLTFEQARELVEQLRKETEDHFKTQGDEKNEENITRDSLHATSPPEDRTLQEALAETGRQSEIADRAVEPSEKQGLADLMQLRASLFSLAPAKRAPDVSQAAADNKAWEAILSRRGCADVTRIPPDVVRELTSILERKVAELSAAATANGQTCVQKERSAQVAAKKSP